jgi:hypothetical protein
MNTHRIACMCPKCTKVRRDAFLQAHPGKKILFTRFDRKG